MEDYKPNSKRFKSEEREKRAEKVVTGKAVTRKKSTMRKLTDEFISEDARNVKSYILGEVLIPAIKKAVSDIVTDGIDMILYGGTRKGSKRSAADRVSYRSYYDGGSRPIRDDRSSSRFSYDDIVLESRGEAEDVLESMDDLISKYGLVRVADLYDLVGVTAPPTANGYGWMNIRNAEIVRVRDGYMIKMPRAVPID